MSEPSFREIQLNTKQVVFLFMALCRGAARRFSARRAGRTRRQQRRDQRQPRAPRDERERCPPAPRAAAATTPKPTDFDATGTWRARPTPRLRRPTPPQSCRDVPPERRRRRKPRRRRLPRPLLLRRHRPSLRRREAGFSNGRLVCADRLVQFEGERRQAAQSTEKQGTCGVCVYRRREAAPDTRRASDRWSATPQMR